MASLHPYSSKTEALRIFDYLCNEFDPISLPQEVASRRECIKLTADRDRPYFPIPFKETEVAAALKAIEGIVASLLADTQANDGTTVVATSKRNVSVDLEKTTAFLIQAYLARVGGYGKLDKEVRSLLKGK